MHIAIKKTRLHTEVTQAFCGSLFIALCSLISIPTIPIAVTLQTMGIILLALFQSPRVCFGSLLFYLAEATLGLPVLAGHSNPFWLLGPSAGYLVAFPVAAYCISYLSRRSPTLQQQIVAISVGHSLIYLFGFVWLSSFIGPKEALQWGVLFFVPIDFLKSAAALQIFRKTKTALVLPE